MKTTIKRPLLALAIATTVFVSCQNNHKDDDSKEVAEDQNEQKFETKASEKDAQLVVDLVDGNYQEIRIASYAADHSSNAEVKSIASTMVTDHTSLLNSLKQLAATKSISVPNEDSAKIADDMKKLADEKPENFDKAWTDKMVDKHQATVNKLENAQKDIQDTDLKALVDNALPIVRSHLTMLQECQTKLKK